MTMSIRVRIVAVSASLFVASFATGVSAEEPLRGGVAS